MPILLDFLPTALALFASQAIQANVLTDLLSEGFYADLLNRCRNHLLVQLAHHLDFAPIETACAAFRHTEGPGAPPTYPVSVLGRCLLVMYLYDLSLRQFEQRLYSDLLVRWFVGLPAFGAVPDHTTLERFQLWVKEHCPRLYFDTVLRQIDELFPHSRQLNQVGDTYAMIANAAEEDLVTRLRHTADCLLREAVQTMPDRLTPTVSRFAWHELFGAPQEPPAFYLSAAERQQRLEAVVLAAHDLQQRFTTTLQGCASPAYPEVRLWVGYLGKILHDEVVILAEPTAAGGRIHRRTAPERRHDPETRLCLGSATDPEATYRVHGEDEETITLGYNVQVAAATDGFIREIQAYTGAVPDQSGVAPLIAEQVEHLGTCPPKLIYDQAAGNGKTRAAVEQVSGGQTQLVAKAMPYAQRSERFGPYDFTLSEDGQRLTCPGGQTSDTAYRSGSGDGRDFRFFAWQCWHADPPKQWKAATPEQLAHRCPLWEQCRDHRQGPGSMRQVFISDYRAQVLAANTYNQTEPFKVEMKQRPLVERIIFELTHYHGARRCRGRGLAQADFQAKMCATAYNLKVWMRKLSRSTPGRPTAAPAG